MASVAIVLTVAAAVSCRGETGTAANPAIDSAETLAAAEALRAGPNLLLITLDTLRADHLGAYGYEEIETPHLDRLAGEGIRFEQVASPVPITLPAHSSLLTGQYPYRHGVRNNGTYRLEDDALTLGEILRAEGYATGGFVASFVLDARFGTAQGFDTYTDFRSEEALGGGQPLSDIQLRGDEVAEQAVDWIGRQQDKFFAWVHLYDPHSPYEPPEPFASRYPDRPYDGEIAYTDAVVGRLRRGLEESGRGADTVVIVVADHGEGLHDHGEEWHTFFVYDSTVRVPMILWAPGALPAGVEVAGQSSLVDVFPTALGLLGVADPAAPTRDGVDLRPLILNPDHAGRPAYSESLVPLLHFGWSELRALRAEGFKYIAAPRPELYDLERDPGETANLLAQPQGAESGRSKSMRSRLEALIAEDDPDSLGSGQEALDPETMERLRSLGYLGGGGTVPDRRDIDPKDKVDVFQAFNDGIDAVIEAVVAERWADAASELETLDEVAPDHFIVQYYLGLVALQQGKAEQAIARLEESLALNASYTLTYVELAKAYRAVGRSQDAAELLREAIRAFPDVVSFPVHLGDHYLIDRRMDDALEAYRVARRLLPRHPPLLSNMAQLYLIRREPAAALRVLDTMVEITPDDPRAWGTLGMVLGGLERLEEAEEAFRRGLELAPEEAGLHYNLGLALLRQGDREGAANAFRRALRIDPGFEPARQQLARLSGRG